MPNSTRTLLTLLAAAGALGTGALIGAGSSGDAAGPAGPRWDVPVITTRPGDDGPAAGTPAAPGTDRLLSTLTALADGIVAGADVGTMVDGGQLLVRVGGGGTVVDTDAGVLDAAAQVPPGCGPELGRIAGVLRGDLTGGAEPVTGDTARGFDGWPVLSFAGSGRFWTVTFGPGGDLVHGIELDGSLGAGTSAACTER